MSRKLTRRDAIKAGGAALAMPYILTSKALGQGDEPGANEMVNIGIIGLGGRAKAMGHTCSRIPEVRIAAICDVFAPAMGAYQKELGEGKDWATYSDFRQMCETENLDGVMIETTTHARAWVTVLAMQMGVDVYIEKPMCLTISEGREMVKAARYYDRVTQVGTQQRSMPMNNWASDLVKNEDLGKCTQVLAPDFVGPLLWTDQPGQPMPEGADERWWDIWTNQAIMRPYHPQLHRGWARWWDYDGGGLSFGVTGWGTHAYDQVNRALGTDETGPTEVVLVEEVADRGVYEDPDNPGLVGPRAKVTLRFPDGPELLFHRPRKDNTLHGLGATFVCEKGTLEIERNRLSSDPEDIIQSPDNPGPNKLDETQYHVQDWADCIKSRERCTGDIEAGQRSHTLCYLTNIARDLGRVGETLTWDPVEETFPGNAEATAMLSRPRRKGYELPELG